MKTRKTGKEKLMNYVANLMGKLNDEGSRKRISINTLRKVSGLSEKSIRMYVSWEHFGSVKKNALIFNTNHYLTRNVA